MKKHSGVTAGKGGAKAISGMNATALKRASGDSKTSSACASKTKSPYSAGNKDYKGMDCSSWGGKVLR
jgi:hypothetical protein